MLLLYVYLYFIVMFIWQVGDFGIVRVLEIFYDMVIIMIGTLYYMFLELFFNKFYNYKVRKIFEFYSVIMCYGISGFKKRIVVSLVVVDVIIISGELLFSLVCGYFFYCFV